MTLLTMINGAQDTIGLTRSTVVVASTDGNTRTLLALAQTEGRELQERYSWPQTQLEATHTTLAAQLQGVMTTIAPGFGYILNQTFWNRTLTQPVTGPLSPQEWQLDENLMQMGVVWRFKKKNGLDYSEDYRIYEQKLANETARVGGKKVLSMQSGGNSNTGIYVPEGSWS